MGLKSRNFGEKDWMVEFGKRFKHARVHLELSQSELAKTLDLTPQRISQIENGKHPTPCYVIRNFCKHHKISPHFLLGLTTKSKE